jgi:hypothetical protein
MSTAIMFYEVIRYEAGKRPVAVGYGDTYGEAQEEMERVKDWMKGNTGEGEVTYAVEPHYDHSGAPRYA